MTLNMGAFGALDQQELFVVDGGVKVLDVGMGVAGVYSAGVDVVGLLWHNSSLACAGTCAAMAYAGSWGIAGGVTATMYGLVT